MRWGSDGCHGSERKKCGELRETMPGLLSKAKDEEFHLHPSVPGVYLECQANALFFHSITAGLGRGVTSTASCRLVCLPVHRALLSGGHDVVYHERMRGNAVRTQGRGSVEGQLIRKRIARAIFVNLSWHVLAPILLDALR